MIIGINLEESFQEDTQGLPKQLFGEEPYAVQELFFLCLNPNFSYREIRYKIILN